MEWVNITAKSLPEAIDLALDNLGVDEAEAEIEVLEEPRQGLFGRLRGNARVRARVKPKATRPKVDRGRNRKRRGNGGSGQGRSERSQDDRGRKRSDRRTADQPSRGPGADAEETARAEPAAQRGDRASAKGRNRSRSGRKGGAGAEHGGRESRQQAKQEPQAAVEEASMEEVSAHLESFLGGLTEAFGFSGPVTVTRDDDGLVAMVEGRHGLMVGPRGRTLDAIQELARVSAQRSAPSNIRIKVDVGGYREIRREALRKFALDAAAEALRDGKERSLEPMSAADRKVIHDALADTAGIETRSAGTEPRRRVVVVPVGTADDDDPGGGDDPEVDEAEALDDGGKAEASTDPAVGEGIVDESEAVGS